MKSFRDLREKTLTPAEKKKREEIAKAMERENPGMDMKKKMAIATWQAKKVAEDWKKDSGWHKPEVKKDKFGNVIKTKNVAKSLAKAAAKKSAEMAKESVELDEGIENMPHGRLKWHMNTGVPHGSYTKAELKKERDRRLSRVDTHAAYKKAKPSMNEAKEDDMPASPDEASMAMKQLEFIEYAAEEMMDHIKSGKPFPEWFQNKLSKAHGEIEGLHSAMGEHGSDDDEDMKEATELDEISLSHLSNAIAKSTGTKNIKTAMKPGEVKKGLDDLKKRLGTLGKEPQKEATELDEISKKTLGSYVKKASADVANRSADNARDYATGNRPVGVNKKAMKIMKRQSNINKAVDKMANETVMSADKKPEKYVKPDGTIGIRMVRVNKNVVDKDA